ncbi:MAG: dTDP-4-dehydrorhamnose reductase [Gammaproteobacteria bacterium]|jgi:dTDP-4-dehydrorhamnose reductase|nr:dTDP-4-dehydrorhamnose reductase [Gammaproteobacteria bacterium]
MKTPPTLLLIGADGQVGWELQRTLAPLGRIVRATLDGRWEQAVNLADAESLTRLIRATQPDVVINAAAYTAVDKAESEPDLAQRINGDAPGLLGRLVADRQIPVLHYSTDFVFSGAAERPYREDDEPRPLNVYGATKLDGENRLLDSGAPALILRTSWVYGRYGQNFLLTMQRLLRERDELKVVDDQIGAPTWARLLAEVSAQLLYRVLRGDIDLKTQGGLYHVSGGGQTSWWGFAKAIQQASGLNCRLLPIPSRDYPSPAKRPAYSVLDNGRLREVFGLVPPAWEASLAQCLAEA